MGDDTGDERGLTYLELAEMVTRYHAALTTVAGQDGFYLIWEEDCACDLCEQDREVARLLGWTKSSHGVPVALAPPQWMNEDEARQWAQEAGQHDER